MGCGATREGDGLPHPPAPVQVRSRGGAGLGGPDCWRVPMWGRFFPVSSRASRRPTHSGGAGGRVCPAASCVGQSLATATAAVRRRRAARARKGKDSTGAPRLRVTGSADGTSTVTGAGDTTLPPHRLMPCSRYCAFDSETSQVNLKIMATVSMFGSTLRSR